MEQNLEKALYLSVGLWLCILSLSFFFFHYSVFEAYVHEEEKRVSEDKLVGLGQENTVSGISYAEVLYKVLEVKKEQEIKNLSVLYGDARISEANDSPDVWVNGIKAEALDVSTLNSHSFFRVTHETGSSGRIVAIYYDNE